MTAEFFDILRIETSVWRVGMQQPYLVYLLVGSETFEISFTFTNFLKSLEANI